MRLPKDLLPQKAVADDLCVSLVTLWRARKSNIPGFPEPVMFRNLVCWRKEDMAKLEDAVLRFRGRVEFEKGRKSQKAADALRRARPSALKRRNPARQTMQRDLFDR